MCETGFLEIYSAPRFGSLRAGSEPSRAPVRPIQGETTRAERPAMRCYALLSYDNKYGAVRTW